MGGEKVAPYVGLELTEKLAQPLVFQWAGTVSKPQSTVIVHGYDVTILIDICKAVIRAHDDGKLLARYQHIVKRAHVVLNASYGAA